MLSAKDFSLRPLLLWCVVAVHAQAAHIIMDVNVGTAKVKIGNKIGKKPTGIHRDFAMTLQKGLRDIRVSGDEVVRWSDERGTRHLVQSHLCETFAKVTRSHSLPDWHRVPRAVDHARAHALACSHAQPHTPFSFACNRSTRLVLSSQGCVKRAPP